MPTQFDFIEEETPAFDFQPEAGPSVPSTTRWQDYVLNPQEQATVRAQGQPMGAFGPIHPEEILTGPNIFTLSTAAARAGGRVAQEALAPVEEMTADWLRRTGINPAAEAGVPQINIERYPMFKAGPIPLGLPGWASMVFPSLETNVLEPIERRVGQTISGFSTPGQAALLPATGLKPVQALFGVGAAANIPESMREIGQAKNIPEAVSGLTGLGIDVAMAGSIGAHLAGAGAPLPESVRELSKTREREVANATKERIEQEGRVAEYPGTETQRLPAEAGGGDRPVPAARLEEKTQVPLSPEAQEAFDLGVEPVKDPVEITERLFDEKNQPFASGRVATITPDGKIQVAREAFERWLKGISPARRVRATMAMLAEEGNHLLARSVLSAKEIGEFWRNLTSLEKAAFMRIYTGQWTKARAEKFHGIELSDTRMGYEALNHFQMRLNKMTSREAVEAALAERWTVQTLDFLAQSVYKLRRARGTAASGIQAAMLDKISNNIQAAKSAVASGAAPGALIKHRRVEDPDAQIGEISLMAPDDFSKWSTTLPEGGQTHASEELGLSLTRANQLEKLYAARNMARERYEEGKQSGDWNQMMVESFKSQYFNEAIEAATGSGSAGEYLRKNKPGYRPPFPEAAGEFGPSTLYKRREPEPNIPPSIGIPMWDRVKAASMNTEDYAPVEMANRPSVGEMESAVLWFAVNPDSKWGLPEGVKDQIHAWFNSQRGGEFDRLSIINDTIRQTMKRRKDLIGFETYADELKDAAEKGEELITEVERLDPNLKEVEWIDNELARLQGLASDYIKSLNLPPEQYAPATLRKKREAGTPEMFLPPAKPGEERGLAPPSPGEVQARAAAFFADLDNPIDLPDFKNLLGELQGQFGATLTRDAAYWPYVDALNKHLMGLSGKNVEALMDRMKLRKDVARALKPGESDPTISRGSIPDAAALPDIIYEWGEDPQAFRRRKAVMIENWRARYGPAQARRLAALGAIIEKWNKKVGPKPQKPWNRKDVGPEDVMQKYTVLEPGKVETTAEGLEQIEQAEVISSPQFRVLGPNDKANPEILGRILTRGAAVEASGKGAPPRTVTRNIVSLKDQFGKIYEVSVWRDPRYGPKVTNPQGAHLPSRHVDADLLKAYDPVTVATLREPVQSYRRVFDNQKAFDEFWGDIGIEGTTGIRTSSFTGPEASVTEAQAGLSRPSAKPAEEPPVLPEKPVESFARELTTPERKPIRTGTPLYRIPRPAPEPPVPSPLPEPPGTFMYRPAPEGAAAEPPPEFSYGTPTGRIIEMPGAQKMGPGWPLREGRMKGKYYSGEFGRKAAYVPSTARYPAALIKSQKSANDLWIRAKDALAAAYARREVKSDIPRIMEGLENSANQYAARAGEKIRFASGEKLSTAYRPLEDILTDPVGMIGDRLKRAKEKVSMQTVGEKRRAAALAVIATGTTQTKVAGGWVPQFRMLKELDDFLSAGRTRAWTMAQDADPRIKLIGKEYQRRVEMAQEAVDYARDHWNDPELMRVVDVARQELKDEIDFENRNGMNVTSRENYTPSIYEGEFWHDNGIKFGEARLFGRAFRKEKTFQNYFEALAAGPYLPASLDIADLIQHRINRGRRIAARNMWVDELQSLPDPDSKKPVAVEPVQTFREVTDPTTGLPVKKFAGWQSPDPREYKLVNTDWGQKPIAVREPFEKLIGALTAKSHIDYLPLGKEAQIVASMLKHGVLLIIDTFHLMRLTEYTMALLGLKSGYAGGYSALHYRAADLQTAVDQGYISQASADWALEKVNLPGPRGSSISMTRQDLGDLLVANGLNATKITDALYKDAVRHIPFIGEAWWKVLGPYNKLLFDRYVPGLMLETAVRHVEKYKAQNPKLPLNALLKDVARDTNFFFGSIGRQGFFKSKTWMDSAQILLLAPQWVEGLIQKEVRTMSRATGLSYLTGRQKLPYMGTLGSGMAKGLAAFFVLTQVLNLITRRQLTFQNPEEGHKMDAFIPIGNEGVWLSPMSVFSELFHDLIRLSETKPTVRDAIMQIGSNKLGPVGKAAFTFMSGKSPTGERYTTTGGAIKGAVSQVVPLAGAVPIAFGTPARYIGHKVAPKLVSPPRPGQLQRQMLASLGGIKVTPGDAPGKEISRLATRWMEKEGLQNEMMVFEPTDAPSYSKLRGAIRNDDSKGAMQILRQLRAKGISDTKIKASMDTWGRRPFTGSDRRESQFKMSLSDAQLDLYQKAIETRAEEVLMFKEFINEAPD